MAAKHATFIPSIIWEHGNRFPASRQTTRQDIAIQGDLVPDHPGIIAATFERFALTELGYRALDPDVQVVLDDIYHTALHICTQGKDGKGDFEALQLGLRQIKGYIFSETYTIEKAITHAAKAAFLSVLIRRRLPVLPRYTDPLPRPAGRSSSPSLPD